MPLENLSGREVCELFFKNIECDFITWGGGGITILLLTLKISLLLHLYSAG